jgi:hypothetical protein
MSLASVQSGHERVREAAERRERRGDHVRRGGREAARHLYEQRAHGGGGGGVAGGQGFLVRGGGEADEELKRGGACLDVDLPNQGGAVRNGATK